MLFSLFVEVYGKIKTNWHFDDPKRNKSKKKNCINESNRLGGASSPQQRKLVQFFFKNARKSTSLHSSIKRQRKTNKNLLPVLLMRLSFYVVFFSFGFAPYEFSLFMLFVYKQQFSMHKFKFPSFPTNARQAKTQKLQPKTSCNKSTASVSFVAAHTKQINSKSSSFLFAGDPSHSFARFLFYYNLKVLQLLFIFVYAKMQKQQQQQQQRLATTTSNSNAFSRLTA